MHVYKIMFLHMKEGFCYLCHSWSLKSLCRWWFRASELRSCKCRISQKTSQSKHTRETCILCSYHTIVSQVEYKHEKLLIEKDHKNGAGYLQGAYNTASAVLMLISMKHPRQSKIRYFWVHFLIQKNIADLQIAVYNSEEWVAMEIEKSTSNSLNDIESRRPINLKFFLQICWPKVQHTEYGRNRSA